MPANLENSAVATGMKRSVFILIPKKGNAKECLNYPTIALISHVSKVILKILQARLQQHVNWELPDVQTGFSKGKGTRDQIANIHWLVEKAREFQKNIYLCFIDYTKAFVWITANWGIFLKRWECQTTLPETCMWMKKQQLEPDMKQQTGSNLRKVYVKAVYFHSAHLTSMQNTSYEILGWMKCKLESRLPEEISITSDMQMSHHFCIIRWGNNGNSDRLFSWAPKSQQPMSATMKLKDACSLEEKLWQT